MPTEENILYEKNLLLSANRRLITLQTKELFHIVIGVIYCKPVVYLMLSGCSSSPPALAHFRMKAKIEYIA